MGARHLGGPRLVHPARVEAAQKSRRSETRKGSRAGGPALLAPSPPPPPPRPLPTGAGTPGHTETQRARQGFIGGGAGLVTVVLQLVERADAGAALLHDATLLRGPLQAARAGASGQLQRPHCGETVR